MPNIPPRQVPERDFKYMGLAWVHAGFSKDPNTQVGAQIVSSDNEPLGSGYNGPPSLIEDNSFSWDRPQPGDESVNRYDLVKHAEVNAISHSTGFDLKNATLYVTALPCPKCMLDIIDAKIGRVVYYDFQGDKNSSLQNSAWVNKSLDMAKRAGIRLEKFQGSVTWIADWTENLKRLGVFDN